MKLLFPKNRSLPEQRVFGKDVHAERQRREFPQERMAEYLHISVGEYKQIETYGHIPKTAYFLLICWWLSLNPFCYLQQSLKQENWNVSALEQETEPV